MTTHQPHPDDVGLLRVVVNLLDRDATGSRRRQSVTLERVADLLHRYQDGRPYRHLPPESIGIIFEGVFRVRAWGGQVEPAQLRVALRHATEPPDFDIQIPEAVGQ